MAGYSYVATFVDPEGSEVTHRLVEDNERHGLIRTEMMIRKFRERRENFQLNINVNDRESEGRVRRYLKELTMEISCDEEREKVRPALKISPSMAPFLPPLETSSR